MPVDWNVYASALQCSRPGDNLKALSMFSKLMSHAESDTDKGTIMVGEASCHAQLGNTAKSLELLRGAKRLSQGHRALLSQVALAEASVHAQLGDFDVACQEFASIRLDYRDLLAEPNNDDFSTELDSRFAGALVSANRYEEAIEIFRNLLQRTKLEDRQRLEVFYGLALFRSGHAAEAQAFLFRAAEGDDPSLAKTAMDYIGELTRSLKQ